MGRIMVVQPPDEEADAEAEGGRPARTVFSVCAVPHGAWHRPMYLEMYRQL